MSPSTITDLISYLPFETGKRATSTLLDLPGQTKLVLCALDGGAEVAAHQVPYQAGVLALSGAFEVMLGETWHALKPGQFLPIPAGLRHALRASEPSHFIVVHARSLAAA